MSKRYSTNQVDRECSMKVRFATRAKADKVLRRMRKHGKDVELYDCEHCGGCHIANASRRSKYVRSEYVIEDNFSESF